MKKNLFMVAAVALMAMVSCNKEEIGNNGVEGGHASDIVFSAELEQPDGGAAVAPAAVQTKTSLGEAVNNVHPVTWNAGDKIKVNGVEFSATAAGSRTDFTTTESFTAAETYYAVYPASAAGASDLTKVTIPASQNGTFAEAAISVAQSNTQSLHFKNVASILKFQVPAACSEVTIESTSNLAGTFPVTFDDKGLPVIGTVTNGSKKITLTGSFVTGTDYYAAVLPGSHTFTIRLDGYLSKASTTAVTTKRAVSSNLKALPALVASGAYLKGSFNNWGEGQSLYEDLNGWYVIKNFKIQSNDTYFKFEKEGNWTGSSNSFYLNNYSSTSKGQGSDVKINAGTYDFYFHKDQNSIYVTTADGVAPGVSRPVRLLVNNAAKKTDLRVYMWDSKQTPILGDWNNRPAMTKTVTLNGTLYTYVELDEKYYGQTLNYKLTWNGGDSGDVKDVYFGQDNYYDLW